MPIAPITSPGSSRSGSRLDEEGAGPVLSRSTRIGLPVSMTCVISVFGVTSATRRRRKLGLFMAERRQEQRLSPW